MLSSEIGQCYKAKCFTKKKGKKSDSSNISFLDGSAGKETACNAWDTGNSGLIPGSVRSPGEGNVKLLQYSYLKNPRGAWQTIQSMGSQRVEHNWESKHSTALHPILYWIFLLINYFPDKIAQGIKIQSCITKRF